jgi:hypothetical protein
MSFVPPLRPTLVVLALAAFLVSMLPGCIPVAMFPSEHRFSGGLVGGRMRGDATEPTTERLGGQFAYRVSIAPLAMIPELWDRDFDFDLGYLVMISDVGSFQHGPTFDLQTFLLRANLDPRVPCGPLDGDAPAEDCAPVGEHQLFRLALRFEGDVRFSNPEVDAVGFGGRAGLRLDFSWFPSHATPVAGATTGSSGSHPSAAAFIGTTWGEYGVAIDFLGGGGVIGSQAYGELLVGVTFRVPAIAGIAIGIP